MVPNTLAAFIGLFLVSVNVAAVAQEAAPQPKPAKPISEIKIGYLRAYEPTLALSVLDVPPVDIGVAGATVAMADNNTTGSFMGQKFTLEVTDVKFDADVAPIFDEMLAKGEKYVLTDLSEKQLLLIADKARDAGVFCSTSATRTTVCVRKTAASTSSTWLPPAPCWPTGWRNIWSGNNGANGSLIIGSHEPDKLFAEALRRAAKRFGGEIVGEKEFTDTGLRGRPIPASCRSRSRCRSSRRTARP